MRRRALPGDGVPASAGAVAHREHQPGYAPGPFVTTTPQGIPGDPLNIGLVGSRREVVGAMTPAGWHPADPMRTFESSAEIGISVVLHRPYQDAPVSTLMYQGRRQDLAFEKAVGTSAAHRHHVRLWQVLATGRERRPVWLGAANSTAASASATGPDRSRTISIPISTLSAGSFIDSLTAGGVVAQIYQVTGIARRSPDATAAAIVISPTARSVVVLPPDLAPSAAPPGRRPELERGGLQTALLADLQLVAAVRTLPFMSRG